MKTNTMVRRVSIALLITAAAGCESTATVQEQSPSVNLGARETGDWSSFISADELAERLTTDTNLLVIDARKPEQYAAGHIPGAVNIPGTIWRTGKATPGQGDSQYIFRNADGEIDVPRYEQLLSEHGVRNNHHVVVYGNHAGKTDGSVPVMILDILGHEHAQFLDGIGLEEWKAIGGAIETKTNVLPRSRYIARANPQRIWNLDDVQRHLGDADVVFYDTRSEGEYIGTTLRSNAYGGRIPGAVQIDYAALMDYHGSKRVLDPATSASVHEAKSITPDKTVCLYCQTATRVSLPYLMLKDLGYRDITVYDASWHEYGNRNDTRIEARTTRDAQP